MIDLDALALLAPPHGEGTVALRTSLFLDLLTEVRVLRETLLRDVNDPPASSALTAEDRAALQAIRRAAEAGDGSDLVDRLHDYYGDVARADHTPRGILYLHIGLLLGMLRLDS